MDPSALRRRLGYLKKDSPGESVGKPRRDFLESEGWSRLSDYVFHRRVVETSPIETLSRRLLPADLSLEDLLFYDTETTGLSAGAGTLIFLVGLARIENSQILWEQFFLNDFPGELEFLQFLRPYLTGNKLFVSYNGKSFDSHVLRTRYVLNALDCEWGTQLDLLHWARRLWKRCLPDCSLSTIEREILGRARVGDVPGWEVPGIYLRYLNSGIPDQMVSVLEHNAQDVLSLVYLFALMNEILELKTTPARIDLPALGSILLKGGDFRGVQVLRSTFGAGSERAGATLSLFYKRNGRWGEAAELWTEMYRRNRSPFAAIELAKYYEHRLRDPGRALALVEELSSLDQLELVKRKTRLEGKLNKARRKQVQ